MKDTKSKRKLKAGPGRKPLPLEDKKSVKMQIFFSPAEHLSLVLKSKEANLKLNDFVRKVLLEGKVTNIESQLIQDTKMNLIKIGNNLNQLARLANSQGMITDLPKVNSVIENLYKLLDSYRR